MVCSFISDAKAFAAFAAAFASALPISSPFTTLPASPFNSSLKIFALSGISFPNTEEANLTAAYVPKVPTPKYLICFSVKPKAEANSADIVVRPDKL